VTDWTLVGAVLAAGLLLGVVLVLLLGRRGGAAHAEKPETLRDLVAERDLLIAQLRELDLDVKRDPEEVDAERYELELRAARVLRELDRAEKARVPVKPAPAHAHLEGLLWGLGSAAFVVVLLVLLTQFAQDRQQGAPITGGPMAQAMAEDIDPELLAHIGKVQQNPGDREARLDLVQALLVRERFVDAWPFIQQIAAEAPDEPRVLLYEATVREAMGQWDRARQLLDRAVAGDPGLTEAWVRRGLVSFELGDWATAAESWKTALEQRPDGQSVLAPVIAEAEKRLAEGVPPPSREPAHPEAAPRAEASPAPAEGQVRIRVDLSEEARARAGAGGLLFVTARPAGIASGPPVAAKRVPVEAFPVELSLGPADSMMGQPFPSPARIDVRLDRDGDATTREPDEPRAHAEGVEAGAEIRLVLQ